MQASHLSSCLTETVRIEEGAEVAGGQPIGKRKESMQFHKMSYKDRDGQTQRDNAGTKVSITKKYSHFPVFLVFPSYSFLCHPSLNFHSIAVFSAAVSHSYFSFTLSCCLSLLLSYFLLNSSTTSSFQLRFQEIFFSLSRLPQNPLPLYSTALLSNLVGSCLAKGLYSICFLEFQLLDAGNSEIKQL